MLGEKRSSACGFAAPARLTPVLRGTTIQSCCTSRSGSEPVARVLFGTRRESWWRERPIEAARRRTRSNGSAGGGARAVGRIRGCRLPGCRQQRRWRRPGAGPVGRRVGRGGGVDSRCRAGQRGAPRVAWHQRRGGHHGLVGGGGGGAPRRLRAGDWPRGRADLRARRRRARGACQAGGCAARAVRARGSLAPRGPSCGQEGRPVGHGAPHSPVDARGRVAARHRRVLDARRLDPRHARDRVRRPVRQRDAHARRAGSLGVRARRARGRAVGGGPAGLVHDEGCSRRSATRSRHDKHSGMDRTADGAGHSVYARGRARRTDAPASRPSADRRGRRLPRTLRHDRREPDAHAGRTAAGG